MSFGSFFKSIGKGFSKAGSWVKHAAEDTYNHALKPIYHSVVKPAAKATYDVAKPVIAPILTATGTSTAKLIEGSTNFVNKTLDNTANFTGQLGNLISNPIIWIAVIVGAIIIIPKVADKM